MLLCFPPPSLKTQPGALIYLFPSCVCIYHIFPKLLSWSFHHVQHVSFSHPQLLCASNISVRRYCVHCPLTGCVCEAFGLNVSRTLLMQVIHVDEKIEDFQNRKVSRFGLTSYSKWRKFSWDGASLQKISTLYHPFRRPPSYPRLSLASYPSLKCLMMSH
jgi:hypothetical protein